MTAVAGVRGEPLTFYFGGTGGGVWKTTDGGSNWAPVSDKDFRTGSVGAIAVAESDPNVVYAGMGEAPLRGNLSEGDGVYRSTDAGRSWKAAGLAETRHISRIRVSPRNPDLVYVAAQGHAFGSNPERGIYRSEDGGKSWKRILFVDERTGASDLALDPGNPRILFAAFWQVVRKPWALESGGPGSGLYKSTDGGDTWKKLEEGLPKGILGKIGVAVSGANSLRVYAMIQAEKGGLYRSDDGGEKWMLVSDDHSLRERAWYYSWVYPDPKDADVVYVPNVTFHKSIDGGKTFFDLNTAVLGDNHDVWIDPSDPNRMIVGCDGGATITFNGATTWSTEDNQPTAQFYRVTTDNRTPYWVYGSQQDSGSVAIASGTTGVGIGPGDWHDVGGGEAGWIAPDPRNPDIVYAGEYGGQITRYDHRSRQSRTVMAWPQLADGHATRDLKYRFQWTAPILISRHDPAVLYHASQFLLRSKDEGETWEEVSPDLTRNDVSKQGYSGGPIDHDVTGVEVYDTIFALSESPVAPGILWAGTDDGLIHVTRDGCRSWTNVTPKGIPPWIQINSLEASPHDRATAYASATLYRLDDPTPYIYRTSDFGETWTRIDAGIPRGSFVRVVREDPARRGLLYAGTEHGLFLSFDDGASWRPFQRNLPPVPITDLTVKGSDLVVATQGRSFWILDDLTPLRIWADSISAQTQRLFPPRTAFRFQTAEPPAEDRPPVAVGTNLLNGVVINYWLREKPKKDDRIVIEILADGAVVRRYSNEVKEEPPPARPAGERDRDKPLDPDAGLNRLVWDMRMFRPTLAPKTVFNEGEKRPPKVAPGSYQIRLTVNGHAETAAAEVRPNPMSAASAADLKAQYDLLAALHSELSRAHTMVVQARDLRAQIRSVAEHAEKIVRGPALSALAKGLEAKLTALEEKLTNPKITADEDDLNYVPMLDHDLVYLAAIVASADARPTISSVKYHALLQSRLSDLDLEFQEVSGKALSEFNRAVVEQKITPVVVLPKAGEEE